MAFRIDDFECEKCKHVQEILYKTGELETVCEECKHTVMNKVLSIGKGKGSHVSWSKWRV